MAIDSKVKTSLLPSVWRHSYEFYSAFAALIGIAFYVYLYFSDGFFEKGEYSGFFWVIPGLLGFLFIQRVRKGLTMWSRRVRLYGKTLDFWSEAKKKKRFVEKKGFVTLGDGYDWRNYHTQASYEARKMDLDKVKPPKIAFWLHQVLKGEKLRYMKNPEDRDKGLGWIHGLSDKIKSLLVSVSDLVDGFIILGTTGSGKTRLLELIVSQDIHRSPKESTIMIDPKIDKDLYPRMMYECRETGRPDDFLFFSMAHPTYSIGMNPIHNYLDPTDVADRLMTPFIKPGEKDPFVAYVYDKIVKVVSGFELIGKRPTINNIFRVIETNPDQLVKDCIIFYAKENQIDSWSISYEQYVKQVVADTEGIYQRPDMSTPDDVVAAVLLYEQHIKKIKQSPVIDSIVTYYREDRRHAPKMIAGVLPSFTPLRSGEIGKILNPDLDDNPERPWWDMSKVVMANKVLYVGTNAMGNQSLSDAVASMFVADLNEVSASRYNYGFTGEHPINLRADESASLITDNFISLLNKGRGSGIRVIMCAQTLPDYVVRLGNDAAKDQVVGNANQVLSLRIKDQSTKEYVSEEMGVGILTTTQTSQSTTPMSSDEKITSFGGSYGERTTEAEVPLIAPDLLGKLPNLEFIASLSGGRVIKGKVPILEKPEGGLPGLSEIPWVVAQKKLKVA